MSRATERIELAAVALVAAYRSGRALHASPESGPASPAEAYAVQHKVWQAMTGEARPTAWKVAAPARDATPIAAPVFPQCFAESPARFPAASFLRPAVEAEIALRFGRDLPARGAPYRRAEFLDTVASAHVAMEVVDTRLADPEAAGPFWRLADSLLNGALVLGDAIKDWRGLDLGSLTARSQADGRLLAEATGRQPQGDIYAGLSWWIDHIGGVQAGDIVTTGSWNGAPRVTPPALLRVEFLGLGMAEAQIA
jgi:2-keto-4-pentenoate hydratase